MTQAYNPITGEAEIEGFLWVQGDPRLQSFLDQSSLQSHIILKKSWRLLI